MELYRFCVEFLDLVVFIGLFSYGGGGGIFFWGVFNIGLGFILIFGIEVNEVIEGGYFKVIDCEYEGGGGIGGGCCLFGIIVLNFLFFWMFFCFGVLFFKGEILFFIEFCVDRWVIVLLRGRDVDFIWFWICFCGGIGKLFSFIIILELIKFFGSFGIELGILGSNFNGILWGIFWGRNSWFGRLKFVVDFGRLFIFCGIIYIGREFFLWLIEFRIFGVCW